jgi:hypothetical protein
VDFTGIGQKDVEKAPEPLQKHRKLMEDESSIPGPIDFWLFSAGINPYTFIWV